MITYLLRRLLVAIPTLVGVLVLTWFLFFHSASPEAIARRHLSTNPTPDHVTSWIQDRGLDQPASVQLRRCTVDMLLFRFGRSDTTHQEVTVRLRQGAGASLAVGTSIFVGTLLSALLVAALAAWYRGSAIDRLTTLFCVLGLSLVYMIYCFAFQYLFGRVLKLWPLWGFEEGAGLLRFLVLPSLVGVVAGIASDIRLYRTFLLEELGKDYVMAARAKGVSETAILVQHVLPNALVPILTNTVILIPRLVMGNLILENVFGIPGLGSYLADAIANADFTVVRALVFLGALLYLLGQVLTDIAYTLADPRVRLE